MLNWFKRLFALKQVFIELENLDKRMKAIEAYERYDWNWVKFQCSRVSMVDKEFEGAHALIARNEHQLEYTNMRLDKLQDAVNAIKKPTKRKPKNESKKK